MKLRGVMQLAERGLSEVIESKCKGHGGPSSLRGVYTERGNLGARRPGTELPLIVSGDANKDDTWSQISGFCSFKTVTPLCEPTSSGGFAMTVLRAHTWASVMPASSRPRTRQADSQPGEVVFLRAVTLMVAPPGRHQCHKPFVKEDLSGSHLPLASQEASTSDSSGVRDPGLWHKPGLLQPPWLQSLDCQPQLSCAERWLGGSRHEGDGFRKSTSSSSCQFQMH